MKEASGERLLWRTLERLDEAERLLLNPEPSGLGALVENLEACWGELCTVERQVRADNECGGGGRAWRAELEEVRVRVSRLAMLLDHARSMVWGWQSASGGIGDAAGGVLLRLNEEG
ncbi:MAG TPA: hypothetical protein VGK29_08815 [Paludibaculum sp.]|jgi:hypothetical protein